MKYTPELTKRIVEAYNGTEDTPPKTTLEISMMLESEQFGNGKEFEPIPERSLIAKLASLGVYKKKEYRTKRGEVPIKKEEYIERIAKLLDVNAELLESLEKVNKSVLAMIATNLQPVNAGELVPEL